MNIFKYIINNGIGHTFDVIWQYKIDLVIQKIFNIVLKNKPLQDIIVIESHNDFDCNGGAFYDFLIKNGYNKKYKIIWLLKHPENKPNDLPYNVECVKMFSPSLKKDYYNVVAKYFTFDNTILKKYRSEQRFFYLTHGCGGLKNVKGLININNDIDYALLQSENYAPIQAEQYSMLYPSKKIVYLGYPAHDVMYNADGEEIKKITSKEYKKKIIWMPTFRKGGGYKRNDSTKDLAMGLPLIKNIEEFNKLNTYLKDNDTLLIIKLHPMQDLSDLKISNMSNIIILTGSDVKKKNIDNYRLLPCTDAMISDYSGVAYEYLQLDKPISYILDDMDDYKLGFVVDNIDSLLAGPKIFNLEDMLSFIEAVINDSDSYIEKRHQIRDYIYKYHDGNSCKRLAEFMGLVK